MSDEVKAEVAPDVEVVESAEEPEVQETEEVQEVEEAVEPDIVSQALEEQKRLKEELAALAETDNVFEQNEALRKKLEEAKKAQELEVENQKLLAELEGIKKNSLINGMMADGRLNNGLKEWADGLTYDQLQAFAEKAPKLRNVLNEKNNSERNESGLTPIMAKFQKEQNRARVH
jgi:hypothetical protein